MVFLQCFQVIGKRLDLGTPVTHADVCVVLIKHLPDQLVLGFKIHILVTQFINLVGCLIHGIDTGGELTDCVLVLTHCSAFLSNAVLVLLDGLLLFLLSLGSLFLGCVNLGLEGTYLTVNLSNLQLGIIKLFLSIGNIQLQSLNSLVNQNTI